jgi:glutamyl-tRNA synthetase
MHLGNVFSALLAWLSAKHQDGEILLRIEDLDPARCRPEYAAQIMADFRWLGLNWDRQSENQSQRGAAYDAALEQLRDKLYPCYCTRDQLHAASAPHASDGRVIYGGTCRHLTPAQRAEKTKAPCLRVAVPEETISFQDGLQGPISMDLRREWGDFILRRADGVAAYQLAVVVDDGASGVTEVVRGRDLLTSTPAQIWLYQCLGLPVPKFYHVPMLLAPDGRRLSKRDRDLDLGQLQKSWTPEQLIGLLAWKCGLLDRWEPVSAQELAKDFSWDRVRREDLVLDSKNLVK